MDHYTKKLYEIQGEIRAVMEAVDGASVDKAIDMILSADKVFAVGVGRVLLMLEAFVKRLNHIGISANFVGAIDEPAITENDVLIVGSGSGESLVPVAIAKKAKELGASVIHICSNEDSTIGNIADLRIRIPCPTKLHLPDESESSQPMSSLFEQSLLILGDIISAMIIERNGIDLTQLWRKHANLE